VTVEVAAPPEATRDLTRLGDARSALLRHLPDLADALAERSVTECEAQVPELHALFEEGRFAGTPIDALQVQYAIGAVAPSLAAATAEALAPRLDVALSSLLAAAGCAGAAAGLVERALESRRASDTKLVDLLSELETVHAALEHGIDRLAGGSDPDGALASALLVRYGVERAIVRVANGAAEALGGMAFIGSPDVATLIGGVSTLAARAPSRVRSAGSLVAFASGGAMEIEQ
jgi:hypothetical protein